MVGCSYGEKKYCRFIARQLSAAVSISTRARDQCDCSCHDEWQEEFDVKRLWRMYTGTWYNRKNSPYHPHPLHTAQHLILYNSVLLKFLLFCKSEQNCIVLIVRIETLYMYVVFCVYRTQSFVIIVIICIYHNLFHQFYIP